MKKIHTLIAALIYGVTSMAQAPATLNLAKGNDYQVDSKIVTTSKTNYMGQDMETTADLHSKYEIKVADKANNNYVVNSTVTVLKVKMAQMGQEMSYDSEDSSSASSPLAAGFGGVLNKEQTVTIDRAGTVVNGPENTTVTSPVEKQMQTSGYGTNLAFVSIPKNVKIGDTWTVTEGDTSSIMNSKTYTVKSVDGEMVTLDFTGTTKSNVTMEANGMEVTTKTVGTSTGVAVVNKSGVVQSSKATAKASGTVSVMGQEMPTETMVESETLVKKVN